MMSRPFIVVVASAAAFLMVALLSNGPSGGATGNFDLNAWGDANCSGSVDPVDSLLTLRFDAGLTTNTGGCPNLGQVVDVQGTSPHPWGDVDCSGEVTPVDSLKLLRFDAALGVMQAAGCPLLGFAVAAATTLTAPAAAGSTEIEVAGEQGFAIGDPIVINPGGANEEENQIAGFGSFLLEFPLAEDHDAGEPVAELLPATPTPSPTPLAPTPTFSPGITPIDMQVVDLTALILPEQMAIDTPTLVRFSNTTRNNGAPFPFGSIEVTAQDSYAPDPPAGCTFDPLFVPPPPSYQAPVNIGVTEQQDFEISCTDVGIKEFNICKQVAIVNGAAAESNPANNEICFNFLVTVGGADIEVVGVGFVGFPANFPAAQFEQGAVTWTTQNNGPFPDPVVVDFWWDLEIVGQTAAWFYWVALPGDTCTFFDGLVDNDVPCGEGDTGGQPSVNGGTCFDGVDNDGDTLIDFAGADPDCLLPVNNIHFQGNLDPDAEIVSTFTRALFLRCFPLVGPAPPWPFSVTFTNQEMAVSPIGNPLLPVFDPDLTNNVGVTTFGFDCVVPAP